MVSYAGINEISVGSGQSRSAYANLLKYYYGPKWDAWIHTEALIADKIGKKKGVMGGVAKVNAVTTSLPQSAGMSSGEGYYLPEPTAGTHVNPRIVARDMYTRLRWTGQSQRAARAGDKAAFSRPKQSDVEDARIQSTLNFARKLYLGYYDVYGTVAAYNEPSLTLAGREDRTSAAANYYKFGNHYMRENQMIGFVDTNEGIAGAPSYSHNTSNNLLQIIATGGTLASPTITLKTDAVVSGGNALNVVCTNATAPAAGDLIIPYASRKDAIASDATKDTDFFTFNGVGSVVLPSSHYSHLYGLSKTTYDKLGGVFDVASDPTSPREFQESRLTLMIHRIRNEGSGGTPDVAMLHDSMMREFLQLNESNRRFAPVQQGKYGYGQIQYMAGSTVVPLVEDWLCPPKQVVVLDTTQWGWHEESSMAPLDDPQLRFVPNFDQTEQVWHKSGNIACNKPHNNGIIDDLEANLDGTPDE